MFVFNTINWNDYKPELAAFAGDALQMPVTIDGSVDVELFPTPRFIAERVSAKRVLPGQGYVIDIDSDRIEVRFAVARLFAGSFDPQALHFQSPVMNVQPLIPSQSQTGGDAGRLQTADPDGRDAGWQGSISISDGHLRVVSLDGGEAFAVSNLHLLADRVQGRSAVHVQGRGTFGGACD